MSNEELVSKIEELSRLNEQLLREREQESRLEYDWTGNLGHWYWNIKTNSVTFNPLKITTLGYGLPADLSSVPYQFFTDKLHPDDHERAMNAMRDHLRGKAHVYEIEYRILAQDGSYHWFYDRGKITQYDEAGHPVFLAGIVFDITEKKRNEELLERENKLLAVKSSTDGLTSLKNHRAIIEELRAAVLAARNTGQNLSVAMFDLDYFKAINDTHGHHFGDIVLSKIAAIIKKNIRETDIAGRYGGEEFLLVFPNTPLSIARSICERIRLEIEAAVFEKGVRITISGGVQDYHGETTTALIDSADENLYEAKRSGRNRIV